MSCNFCKRPPQLRVARPGLLGCPFLHHQTMAFAFPSFEAGLRTVAQRLCRTYSTQVAVQARSAIPAPTTRISTPEAFLTAIGRSAETKVKAESWEEFWKMDRVEMRGQGLAVKDRRYILWAMQQFRLGKEPTQVSYPPTPKKKVRGRGPAVQNGKRIRSRRKR